MLASFKLPSSDLYPSKHSGKHGSCFLTFFLTSGNQLHPGPVWLGSVPRLGARDERHSTHTWQTSREDEEKSRAGEERKTCCCEKI